MVIIVKISIDVVIINEKYYFYLKLIKIINLVHILNWVTLASGEVNNPNDNKTFLFSLNQKVLIL